MAVATAEKPQSVVGPKNGGPARKQPSFNWEADDKYSKLKNFRLEVNNIITSYNTPNAEELVTVIKLVRKERPAIYGIINTHRKRKMQHIRRLILNSHEQVQTSI